MIVWKRFLWKRFLPYCAATALASSCLFAQTPARVQTFALHDAAGLTAPNVKAEAVSYQGRKCVRLTTAGEDNGGLLLLPGTDSQDG